jgi:hypothetical protein
MSITNLILIIDTEECDDYKVGDILEISHIDDLGVHVLNTEQRYVYDHQFEYIVDHEACFIESFDSDGKIIKEDYVFTFGERMTLEGFSDYYYVNTTEEGSVVFSREPFTTHGTFESHGSLDKFWNNFKPYVESLVLTQSELDKAFGCSVQVV